MGTLIHSKAPFYGLLSSINPLDMSIPFQDVQNQQIYPIITKHIIFHISELGEGENLKDEIIS